MAAVIVVVAHVVANRPDDLRPQRDVLEHEALRPRVDARIAWMHRIIVVAKNLPIDPDFGSRTHPFKASRASDREREDLGFPLDLVLANHRLGSKERLLPGRLVALSERAL